MKVCAACYEELPKESFSKKQWKLKQHERRCIGCIDSDRDVAAKEASPKENEEEIISNKNVVACDDAACEDEEEEEGPTCWICLDGGESSDLGPLRRDCSCRGTDAGYAHLECLV